MHTCILYVTICGSWWPHWIVPSLLYISSSYNTIWIAFYRSNTLLCQFAARRKCENPHGHRTTITQSCMHLSYTSIRLSLLVHVYMSLTSYLTIPTRNILVTYLAIYPWWWYKHTSHSAPDQNKIVVYEPSWFTVTVTVIECHGYCCDEVVLSMTSVMDVIYAAEERSNQKNWVIIIERIT